AYSAAIQSAVRAAFEIRTSSSTPAKYSLTEAAPPIHSCPVPFAARAAPDAASTPFTYSRRVPAVPSCTTATWLQPVWATLPTMFVGPPATQASPKSSHTPYHGSASRDLVTIPFQAVGNVPTCAQAESVKLAVAANLRSAASATVTRALVPLN